jgi:hypothetical protein
MALNTTAWSAIDTARAALATARQDTADAFDAAEQAIAALADAQRTLSGSDLDSFNQAVTTTGDALTTAKTNEATARQNMLNALNSWVPTTLSLDGDVSRVPANAPFVMFPVRIETKFGVANGGPVLFLRVYPDEIFLNVHETALTRDERDAAVQYFENLGDHDDEGQNWRELTRTLSPQRAAYVLRTMQPHDPGQTISITFFDTDQHPEHQGMLFPTPKLRPSGWTRPGEAILPDRWVIQLTNGAVTRSVNGPAIPEPLSMTADPSVAEADLVDIPGTNGAQKIDPKILWTVDYATAVNVGMALTIPLSAAEAAAGFDRVTVIGVKTSVRSDAGSVLMEKLLDAHHYTRGLAVVPQGSPTNNTEDAPTPVSRAAADPNDTFHLERDPNPSWADHADRRLSIIDDGDFLARALGVPNGAFLNIAGARQNPLFGSGEEGTNPAGPAREQVLAAAMISVLYEVLFGHFGREMVGWNSTQQANAKTWVTSFLRARGPAPAIRVGTVPYGILPALSIVRWATRNTSDTGNATAQSLEGLMLAPLQALRDRWLRAAIAQAPRVTPNSVDPSADLMTALAMYPSAREARVRNVTKQHYAYHQTTFFGFDFQSVINRTIQAVSGAIQRAAIPQWANKPIASLVFDASSSRFTGDLVAPPSLLSETTVLTGTDNYLTTLASTTDINALLGDTLTVTNTKATVFYKLLRHSLILEVYQVALGLLVNPGVTANVAFDFGFWRELISIHVSNPPATATFTPQLVLTSTASEISTSESIGAFILDPNKFKLTNWQSNLEELSGVTTAELERLFTETMDLASHRLDAWLTAFATRRLSEIRTLQTNSTTLVSPTGDYLGAYGYVENLRPATRTTDPTTGLPIQAGNGGLIHAPSMTHAAAAGVLRNGYLTHKDEDGQKCAVDLSSARARAAKLVLDELRNGQSLGAVIGYRFERRLQERAELIINSDPTSAGAIQNYRYTLRNRFPLVANKQSTGPAGTTPDQLAARNVVDGLALRTAFKASPSTVNPVADLGATAGGIVLQELNSLDDLVDGVSDLVTAESILHFVRGNTSRTAGTLDALARGTRPPEAEMTRSVLRGSGLTYKNALLISNSLASNWPSTLATYRSEIDSILDLWIGALLDDPKNVVCQVTVLKTDPTTQVQTTEIRQVSLADLSYREQRDGTSAPVSKTLRPTDVVALARAVAQANQGSLLDRWITTAAIEAAGEQVTGIDYSRVQNNLTFPEAMEVAMTIGQLLSGARTLRPEDLVPPGELTSRKFELEDAAQLGVSDFTQNVEDLVGFLQNAQDLLNAATTPTAQRIALENASAFVASAYPSATMTDDDLAAMVPPIVAELQSRIDQATGTPPLDPNPTPPSTAIFQRSLDILRDVLGLDAFATFAFNPPGPDELAQSFASIASELQSEPVPDAPAIFLQQATEMRDGLGRWRRLSLYAGALGRPRPRLDVAQIPFVPDERWIGLPFTGTQSPPPINGFSPLIYSYGTAAPDTSTGTTWAGLLLDDWNEILPSAEEETGIAFHYDSPGAEAPQVILVAVPSSTAQQACVNDPSIDGWQGADLSATISETLDLAKIRSVDAQMVDFGQLFPTIYLTENTQRSYFSTSWLNQLFTRLGLRI